MDEKQNYASQAPSIFISDKMRRARARYQDDTKIYTVES